MKTYYYTLKLLVVLSFLPFSTGIFFVLPCIESYQKVDLRTITLGVPPQEVGSFKSALMSFIISLSLMRKKQYIGRQIYVYNIYL